MKKIIYTLGWKYTWIRILWYRLTNKWLWGIIGRLKTSECFPVDDTFEVKVYDQYQKYIEEIFKL